MISTLSSLGTSAAFSSPTSSLIMAVDPLHFQLPPTKNFPCPAIAVTLRVLRCGCLLLREAMEGSSRLQAGCFEAVGQLRIVLEQSASCFRV